MSNKSKTFSEDGPSYFSKKRAFEKNRNYFVTTTRVFGFYNWRMLGILGGCEGSVQKAKK
jgi:hypothetical protein